MISETRLTSLRREILRLTKSREGALEVVRALHETNWQEVFDSDQQPCDRCGKPVQYFDLCTYPYVDTDRKRKFCSDCYKLGREWTCSECGKSFMKPYSYFDRRCPECVKSAEHIERQCIICKQVFHENYLFCDQCWEKMDQERTYEEYQKVKAHWKRARDRNLPSTLTQDQWLVSIFEFGYKCAYCLTGTYEIFDHFIPIVCGGGTTADNCIPACKACSRLKGKTHPKDITKIPREAIERVQAYLDKKRVS